MAKKFLKLNPAASSFVDPGTGFNLAGKEVKEIHVGDLSHPKFKTVATALKDGHLREATEDEFHSFHGTQKELKAEADVQRKKDLQRAKENKLLAEADKSKDLLPDVLEDEQEEVNLNEVDETEDEEEDDDDEPEELTDGEMRENLKASALVKPEEKKNLLKLKGKKLKALYDQIFNS